MNKELIIRSNSDNVDFALLKEGKLIEYQKDKDNKSKFSTKKREAKLTVSRALSEDLEFKSRSLASIKFLSVMCL